MDNRELDAALAERLFGWKVKKPDNKSDWVFMAMVPRFSTTGNGMLRVLEAMRKRGIYAEIEVEPDLYRVSYYRLTESTNYIHVGQSEHVRLPEANAEAALEALSKEAASDALKHREARMSDSAKPKLRPVDQVADELCTVHNLGDVGTNLEHGGFFSRMKAIIEADRRAVAELVRDACAYQVAMHWDEAAGTYGEDELRECHFDLDTLLQSATVPKENTS